MNQVFSDVRSKVSGRPRLRPGVTGLALIALAAALWPAAGPAQEDSAGREKACVITLDGKIDPLTERTLELRVKKAFERQPRFIILSIESPGGDYAASRTIAWNLNNLQGVRTVAFLRGPALSGATMIAFGCDDIFMTEGSQLGDVMPIRIRQKLRELQVEVAEKMISPVRKDLQQLAEKRGYPLDVAAAMVDPKVELHKLEFKDPRTGRIRYQWLGKPALERLPQGLREHMVSDEVVCPAGELLTLGPAEAQQMGIAREQPGDINALCKRLADEFSISEVVPEHVSGMWWEHVVRFMTWWPVKLLLFVIGAIAMIVSLSSPGLGIPEGIALIAFGAVFFGSYLIGLADWIEPLLFLVGLALLAVEVFITPGFGVMGVLGGLCMAAALLLSFQDFVVPGNPLEWDEMFKNAVKTALGCSAAVIGLFVTLRFLPKTGVLPGLIHEHTQAAAPEAAPALQIAPVGTTCETVTPLRPVGKVSVGKDVFDARAEDGMLPVGTTVVVVGHSGVELVVASRPEATTLPSDTTESEVGS